MKKLLEKLCGAFGTTGLEGGVSELIENEISQSMPKNAEIIRDNLGGICLHIKNEGKQKLMICAHMDEVGFMVTGICEDGLLKFGTVGGINPLVLCSKRLVSENGIYGVITSKPPHLLRGEERKRRTEICDMRISIGATCKADAEKYVKVGEAFTFADTDFKIVENCVVSKALDDRHGCASMLYAIKELVKNEDTSPYDLYFAFTTREEIGVSGALCMAEIIKPDMAIVIESKAVLDLPGVGEDRQVGALGEGALISYADLGAIMDRELTEKLISVCERNGIKYQINRAVAGGNDSASIQKSASGARVSLMSAPSRYIHSSASVIDYRDFEAICKAVYNFVREEK
jgi:endoglucanase